MRLRLTLTLIGFLAVFVLLWSMWPSPINPAYWDEPPAPAMTGPLEPDDALADAQLFPVGASGSAEGVAVSENGDVFFGTVDGRIRRLTPAGPDSAPIARDVAQVTRTPILGLEWLQPGVLGVAAISGLYALDVDSRAFNLISAGALAYLRWALEAFRAEYEVRWRGFLFPFAACFRPRKDGSYGELFADAAEFIIRDR